MSPVNHSQCIDTHFSVLEDERHRLLDAAVERSRGASRALPRGVHPVRPREEAAREVIPGATGSEGPNVLSVCLVGVRRERIKRLPELPALLATIDPASIPEAPVDAVSDLADALEATVEVKSTGLLRDDQPPGPDTLARMMSETSGLLKDCLSARQIDSCSAGWRPRSRPAGSGRKP